MEHSALAWLMEWPLGMACALLYLFVLTGVPKVEDLPRRARFAAARRRSPWLTGIALFFIAGSLVCATLYFV